MLLAAVTVALLLPITASAEFHEGVQLWAGGPYFATVNLGAEKPEDYGDYYAWGEISPYYSSLSPLTWKTGKSNGYSWESYCGSASFTEWSSIPYDPTFRVLMSSFDAAMATWGSDWRTPTKEELGKLLNPSCCSLTETNNYNNTGVGGLIVTGATQGYTDKHIFLPFGGFFDGTSVMYSGGIGIYWTASLHNDTKYATCLTFGMVPNPLFGTSYRYYGRTVRPVSDVPQEPHVHGTGADTMTFMPWDGGAGQNTMPAETGNYALMNDITLSSTWEVPAGAVRLCLNGHTVKMNGTGRVITVGSGATLNLYDCHTAPGSVTGGKDGGVYIGDGGTFNMHNGLITGNETNGSGGGVFIEKNGKFNMVDGEVSGNISHKYGGGVCINPGGLFNLAGGAITDNRGLVAGGVADSGTFTMSGGSVSYNTAGNNMGGIQIGGGTFTMTGGTVTGNVAEQYYGGVYVGGTFCFGGSAKITDNTASGQVSNVYLNNRRVISVVTGALAPAGASAGVTADTVPPVSITGENDADYSSCFTSDNADYTVVNENNIVRLMQAFPVINATPEADRDKNNGFLAMDKNKAAAGETVTVTVTPVENGKLRSLEAVYNDGEEKNCALTQDATDTSKYTFSMPAFEVTVSAEFEAPPHVHQLVKISGQPATETAPGFKDYWECRDSADACGALFEDENGTALIADLAVWKAEGGNGYLPPLTPSHVHHPVKVSGQPATETAPGFKDYWECRDSADACGALFEDENATVPIADLAAWKAEGGNGYLPPLQKPAGYKIIKGAEQVIWSDAQSATFTSDADFSKFVRVEVDGWTVERKYYDAKSGSTVITFNREAIQKFVKKFGTGKHKLTIVSTDGSATTTFTLKKKPPVPPKTGDSTDPALLIMLLLLSAGAIIGMSVRMRKNQG